MEEIYVVIGGPLLLAVVAYALTSWRERAFEKRKTSFHAKREAFTRMNDALSRVGGNLAYLKGYTAQEWPNETPQQLGQSVIGMLGVITLAREDERAVEGSGLKDRIDRYNKIVEGKDTETEEVREAVRDWLVTSLLSITYLRLRLAAHYSDEFARAYFAADILMNNDEVEKAAEAAMAFLMADLVAWAKQLEKAGSVPEPSILAGLTRLGELHRNLRVAMRADLDKTL